MTSAEQHIDISRHRLTALSPRGELMARALADELAFWEERAVLLLDLDRHRDAGILGQPGE